MPTMNEWEKSQKLTSELRSDILAASIRFCFEPLREIFEELYIVLAWDLYHMQTPAELLTLYDENKESMGHLVEESDVFYIEDIEALPVFNGESHSSYNNKVPTFPIKLPLLNKTGRRHSQHTLVTPLEGTNKKERALHMRYLQLRKDIKVFKERIALLRKELVTALNSCTTTKQFNTLNPEFEGVYETGAKKVLQRQASERNLIAEQHNGRANIREPDFWSSLTSLPTTNAGTATTTDIDRAVEQEIMEARARATHEIGHIVNEQVHINYIEFQNNHGRRWVVERRINTTAA